MNSLENSDTQVRSPGYPSDHSWIDFDSTTAGAVDALFNSAICDHGNDRQFTWHSYAENSDDTFTVELLGFSKAPLEQTDYFQTHEWQLTLHKRRRTLVIDTGMKLIQRFEGELLVPGSNLDVSDLIAASLNIRDYNDERHNQGWDPIFDDMLRDNGLL